MTKFEELVHISKIYAKSAAVPTCFKGKPEDLFVIFEIGDSLGFSRPQSLNSIYLRDGVPTLKGTAYKAFLLSSPLIESITQVTDEFESTCKIKRKNLPEFIYTFSMEDAAKAGLLNVQDTSKSPWYTFPKRMLEWRAFNFCAMDAAADLLMGIKTLEEVLDTPDNLNGEHEKLTLLISKDGDSPDERPELTRFKIICKRFNINDTTKDRWFSKAGVDFESQMTEIQLLELNEYILSKKK